MQKVTVKFSAVIAVGPGDRELMRLSHVMTGLSLFERQSLHEVVLVDDSRGKNDYSAVIVENAGLNVRVVKTPRAGRGDSWRGGLVVNILYGIDQAFQNSPIHFIVKLDTDSFVMSPFSMRIASFIDANPRAGMIGSTFAKDLNGAPVPPSTWKPNLKKYGMLIRPRRNPRPHLETALWGRNRWIRKFYLQAIANGWDAGATANGGGYALSREAYDRWTAHQMLRDPLLWLDSDLTEDVVVALLCYAAGMSVIDFNGPGEVFGVQYQGLGFPPAELLKRGYGIVHSVKHEELKEELALREQFLSFLPDYSAAKST